MCNGYKGDTDRRRVTFDESRPFVSNIDYWTMECLWESKQRRHGHRPLCCWCFHKQVYARAGLWSDSFPFPMLDANASLLVLIFSPWYFDCIPIEQSVSFLYQLEDDAERQCLCSILSELRPVEIIRPSEALSFQTEKVLMNQTRNPLVNRLVPSLEFWDAEKTINELRNIYGIGNGPNSDMSDESLGALPDIISRLVKSGQNASCTLSALGGCIFYLKQAFLDKALLKCAMFEELPCSGFVHNVPKAYMILDAAALENLEILENNRNGSLSGYVKTRTFIFNLLIWNICIWHFFSWCRTLLAQLDHCVTSFGKRLLKSWLARPLYNKNLIVERQDAIATFKVSRAFWIISLLQNECGHCVLSPGYQFRRLKD